MARKRVKIFNELKEALEDVRDYRRGKRADLRVTELPTPPNKDRPSGNPPDSPVAQSQPDGIRHLPERKPERRTELGAVEAPPTARRAEAAGDREEEPARAAERVRNNIKGR